MASPRLERIADARRWIADNWTWSEDAVTMVTFAYRIDVDRQLLESLRRPFVERALQEADAAVRRARGATSFVTVRRALTMVRTWLHGKPEHKPSAAMLLDAADQVHGTLHLQHRLNDVMTAAMSVAFAVEAAGAVGPGFARLTTNAAYYNAESKALSARDQSHEHAGSEGWRMLNAQLADVVRQVIPFPRPTKQTGHVIAHGPGWVIYSTEKGKSAALADPLYSKYNVQVAPRAGFDGWLPAAMLTDAIDYVGWAGTDAMRQAGVELGLLPKRATT